MNLSELLHKRRSTRHYDASIVIERDELTRLLNAACRAPSGNNAQPWRFLIITEAALREKLSCCYWPTAEPINATIWRVFIRKDLRTAVSAPRCATFSPKRP